MKFEDLHVGQFVIADTAGKMEAPTITGLIRSRDENKRSVRILSSNPSGEFDVHESLVRSLAPQRTYTLEEIRAAFWKNFHEEGELFFDYLGSEKQNENSTRKHWADFEEALLK